MDREQQVAWGAWGTSTVEVEAEEVCYLSVFQKVPSGCCMQGGALEARRSPEAALSRSRG